MHPCVHRLFMLQSLFCKLVTELYVKVGYYPFLFSPCHIADDLVVRDRAINTVALVVGKFGRSVAYHSVRKILFALCGDQKRYGKHGVGVSL